MNGRIKFFEPNYFWGDTKKLKKFKFKLKNMKPLIVSDYH